MGMRNGAGTNTVPFFAKNREKYGYECRQRLIFPGRFQPSIFSTDELNCRVRNGNGWTLIVTATDCIRILLCVSTDLFSRAASSRVSSALMSLTAVFGMGTGGPSSLQPPTVSVFFFVSAPTYFPGPLPAEYLQH